MIRLDTTTRVLKLFLSGSVTTSQLAVTVCYSDQTASTYNGATQLSLSNNTTAVTICNAPASSTVRDIDMLTVFNTDTASAVVTIQLVDGATAYNEIVVTLASQDKLTYTHGSGWQVVTNSGNIKQEILSTSGVSSVTATAPLASSGGASPNLTIAQATTTTSGYLSSTDWNTFNSKGSGTVTSITAGTGLSGGTITGTGTIALANTAVTAGSYGSASSVGTFTVNAQGQLTASGSTTIAIAASQITSGQVAVAQGGTNGTATPTAGAVAYGTGTAYAFSLAGTSGYVLASGGASTPTWTNSPTLVGTNFSAIPNAALSNSSITINGNSVSLGGSTTVTAATTSTLTIGTGLSGTSFNGSAPVTIAIANTTVTAGSYTNASITVNAQGQITSASSGTAPVTSVTGTSPVVSSGGATPAISLAASYGDTQNPYASKTANYFLAAPNGSAGVPTFRAIVAADIPTLNQNTTGTASNVTGTVAVANGGTGLTSLTAGYIPYGNGTSAFASNSGFTFSGTTLTAPVLIVNSTTSTTPNLTFNASNSGFTSGATVANNYLQTVIQNKSGTSGASTNYVVSNDLGTDSTYYAEYGMNSSVFTASGTFADFYSINNGIYFSGHDGDISYGSGNGYKTYLTWGTSGQSAHVINAVGAIGLTTNLGTSSATTGTSGFGTSGQPMLSGGSAGAPTWGTLGISAGGTGQTTAAAGFNALSPITTTGDLIIGNGTNSATRLGIGANGYVLTSNGTTASWQAGGSGSSITNTLTSTNATYYMAFQSTTSGTTTVNYVNSSVTVNPSNGVMSTSVFNATNGIYVNSKTVSASYTIPSGSSAMSAGPMTIASGQSVTISSGSRWVVL